MTTSLCTMEDSGIDSDPKPPNININRISNKKTFMVNDCSVSSNYQTQQDRHQRRSTKQLQKKLEARIEQAKRIQRNNTDYIKLGNKDCKINILPTKSNSNLIPIQRLPIPNCSESTTNNEHYPLVEYWQSDTTDSEDETTLFPLTRDKQDCGNHKQDLTDTFSIQELSEGSEDSLNLIDPNSHHSSHLHTRTWIPTGCFNCSCHIL